MFFLAGCSREEAPSRTVMKADPPSVYMKDKDFRKKLDTQTAKRSELAGVREQLLVEMERRVDAMREKLEKAGREGTPGTEGKAGREGTPGTGVTDEDVKKELEKDPEWNSLARRIRAANEAYEDNRKETTRIFGERTAPRPVKVEK